MSGVRETSISAVTGDSFVCATPVLRWLSTSLLPGHLLPEAFCDSIQAEMMILSSELDLSTIVSWAVIVQEKGHHPNMRAMGQGDRGDGGTLFFSSSLMDHHGQMCRLFLTRSVSITADSTVGQKSSTNSMKGSFVSGKCFSWSFQARPEVTLLGCCSWQTGRRGSQNTPYSQNASWGQDK